MNFFKLSMLAIFCSLIVGFMPTFFRFAFIGERSLVASVAVPKIVKKETIPARFLVAEKVKIPVYLADSSEKRVKGLGGLTSIPADYGMFFIFDYADYQSIWMKDMLFPIDIIWIDENNKIVHIEKNISPDTYPKIFTAPAKARFVLELNAGMSAIYELKISDAIFLKP